MDLIIDADESNFYDDTIYDEEWEFYTEELDSIQQDFWQLKEFNNYLVPYLFLVRYINDKISHEHDIMSLLR